MGFFTWITEGVRRAVVRGLEQAADDINEAGGEMEITVRLPSFREPLRLPQEEPPNGKRQKSRV